MKAPEKAQDTSDPQLVRLFGESTSNNPIVYSALKQAHPSSVYVDSLVWPTRAVLHIRFRNNVCYAGETDSEFLASALGRIRQNTAADLYWPDSWDSWQPPWGFDRVEESQEYLEHPQEVDFYDWFLKDGLGNLRMASIDGHLLERCAWGELMQSIYGNFEQFNKSGFGFALCDGNQPVSESYAAFLGFGLAEIGLVTDREHRRKGYATLTCAHLIAYCLRMGYRIRWSCSVDNIASVKTAEKLGFRDPKRAKILSYPRV